MLSLKNKPTATWINIDGVHQLDNIEKLEANSRYIPLFWKTS